MLKSPVHAREFDCTLQGIACASYLDHGIACLRLTASHCYALLVGSSVGAAPKVLAIHNGRAAALLVAAAPIAMAEHKLKGMCC